MKRQTDEIVKEIVNELNYMITVPAENMSMREQQVALSISSTHINHLIGEMVENEIYLLERLKHSEAERFKK